MARPRGSIRLADAGPGPRLEGFYTWRDPARLGPGRLAELAEHDARHAAQPPVAGGPARQQTEHRAAREAVFAELRDAGMDVPEAAGAVGVSLETGRVYERARKRAAR
jgi:hypothetical protein